jgi:hypothetical protein
MEHYSTSGGGAGRFGKTKAWPRLSLDDFRGLRRDRVVPHSKIKRPDAREYHGGYDEEAVEGSARAEGVVV